MVMKPILEFQELNIALFANEIIPTTIVAPIRLPLNATNAPPQNAPKCNVIINY